MTTLVTGATGFVGWHLVNQLVAGGEAVRILVPPGVTVPAEWRERVDVVVGDLTAPGTLPPAVNGASTVYHLAAEIRNAARFTAVNVDGTRALLSVCASRGPIRVVHMSSVGVIGARLPGKYDETSACNPRQPYEISKWRGEQLALEHGQKGPLHVTVVRPTNIFGPRLVGSSDSFLGWLRAIKHHRFRFIGPGDAVANYVYAEDVAASCVHLAHAGDTIGEIYHVADPCTIKDLVTYAAQLMGAPLPGHMPLALARLAAAAFELAGRVGRFAPPLTFSRVQALTSHRLFSGEKLQRRFNLPVGWREGLRRTIVAYTQHGLL